ncbi:CPBP family intramembrane metalloprotease [Aquibacillus halophilus]|uniref:CPBP family intramembrane metalloprotease n=1 Tax=Aquibacillus halophilus TaxID=930132 RepID=A0A6A8DGU3_9BACI|nr:type II CAAX endopeptidase family protein [Aquibacillus halophilus]MRH44884.1 CPBP family intramembrane metalloprotease [Aquibacillus halophilus]
MPKKYWYVLLTYLIMQLSGIVVLPIINLFNIDALFAVVSWSLFSFIVALVVIMYLLRDEMKDVRGNMEIGTIILWSILGIFLAFFAQFAAIIIETFVLNIKPGSQNTMDIMAIARSAPIFIIVVTIIAPILEEIIFRKVIFGSIYKRTNFIIAALASALVFGLVHNDNPHILVYTAMGIVFSFLYVKTKRIIVPIIAHMSINTYAVVGQLTLDQEELDKMLEQLEQLQMIIIGG